MKRSKTSRLFHANSLKRRAHNARLVHHVLYLTLKSSSVNATDAVSIAHHNYTSADVKSNTFTWWIDPVRTESDRSYYPQSPASLAPRVLHKRCCSPEALAVGLSATVSRVWCAFRTRPLHHTAVNPAGVSLLLWYDCIVFLTLRSNEYLYHRAARFITTKAGLTRLITNFSQTWKYPNVSLVTLWNNQKFFFFLNCVKNYVLWSVTIVSGGIMCVMN